MKILHTVQLYEPAKGGSEEVVKQLSERLAARGHQVTVATASHPDRNWVSLNGVDLAQFEIKGNSTLGIDGDVEGYRKFLLQFDGEVMLNYAAQIWSTDLVFDLLDEITMRKVMVPCGYSALRDPQYSNYFSDLPEYLGKYDALVYMSPNYQDKSFGDKQGLGDRAAIIPNGAALEEFGPPPRVSFRDRFGIKTRYLVVSVANHHELKGHRNLVRTIRALHRKDVTLVIIGEPIGRPWVGCYYWCRTQAVTHPRLKVVTGVPREYIVSAYTEADVFALASETECAPLVIYESMAAGTPFVSTNCGNVKDNSEFGVVVDEPSAMGEAINFLLSDESARNRLGKAGRSAWENSFTWDKIVGQYEALYQGLLETNQ